MKGAIAILFSGLAFLIQDGPQVDAAGEDFALPDRRLPEQIHLLLLAGRPVVQRNIFRRPAAIGIMLEVLALDDVLQAHILSPRYSGRRNASEDKQCRRNHADHCTLL
ncbi:MAG TPA: hypothetical protein VHD86_11515 [Xanthobacteraceae bacterium]|nr:hypothetical protein [Xanthobacteraceae bacterium]